MASAAKVWKHVVIAFLIFLFGGLMCGVFHLSKTIMIPYIICRNTEFGRRRKPDRQDTFLVVHFPLKLNVLDDINFATDVFFRRRFVCLLFVIWIPNVTHSLRVRVFFLYCFELSLFSYNTAIADNVLDSCLEITRGTPECF